jgi:DNA-binding MarR family transcriptional regulator
MELARRSTRVRQVDDIAEALPQRAADLARLFLARSSLGVSRTEMGVIRAVAAHPQRITDLAAAEGVTQPAITLLVNRLQRRGWVEREPDPGDGRVVRVALTQLGHAEFDRLRAEYRALLHEEMATLPDEDIDTLARAVEVLDDLVASLRERA